MQMHQFVDACICATGFTLAFLARSSPTITGWFHQSPVVSFDGYAWLYLVIPLAPFVLESQGYYNPTLTHTRIRTAWLLAKGLVFSTVALILAVYLLKLDIARAVIILFGCISFVLILMKEEAIRLVLNSNAAQRQYRRRFILVGTGEETTRIRRELKHRSMESIEVTAELDLQEVPVSQLVDLLHEHSINGVIISAKRSWFDPVEAAIKACELEGIEVWLVADFFRTQISRTSFDDFYGQPVMVFRTTPETSWQGVLKQAVDFIGALVLLAIAALPLALVALLIRLTSPGPVLFRQQRSGLNGRPFTIYKFRTMVTNAEQLKHELAAMNEMSGPVFKVTNDPRITPLGRMLRKFSIDEFPQLINVLRGDMSLVGPRPLPVDEVKRFHDLAHRRRLSVKPGLTCLWQISGRNNVKDFKDWVRLDLEYIDNWSLWLDFKILCRTVPVVLGGTGAK
jgi:exopolysaccharide biosynthesis polyprenyl glycosylphosphotransferase